VSLENVVKRNVFSVIKKTDTRCSTLPDEIPETMLEDAVSNGRGSLPRILSILGIKFMKVNAGLGSSTNWHFLIRLFGDAITNSEREFAAMQGLFHTINALNLSVPECLQPEQSPDSATTLMNLVFRI
jgi:hypothetical protein